MITEKPISIPTATMAASHLLFFPFSSLFTFRSYSYSYSYYYSSSCLTCRQQHLHLLPCHISPSILHSITFFSFSLLKSQSYGKPPGTKLPFKQMTFN